MPSPLDVGKSFLADLLNRIPEDQRAEVASTFEANAEAVEALGNGAMMRSDYSKRMNELNDWYKVNKEALESVAAGGNPSPAPARTGDPSPRPAATGMTQEAVEKLVAEREKGVAAFIAATTPLALKHYQQFGEVLDFGPLLADPRVNEVGLLGVYDAKFKERYDLRAKEAQDKLLETAREEGRSEARKQFAAHPAGYVPAGSDPGVLAALNNTDPATNQYSPEAAAAEYQQLVAQRSGAGAAH